MPVLPFINDSPENIQTILTRARDCGAGYVIPMFGMTLRKGSREYYYNSLNNISPQLKPRYEQTYGEQYECMSPNYRKLWDIFNEIGLPLRMNFYEPETDKQLSLF